MAKKTVQLEMRLDISNYIREQRAAGVANDNALAKIVAAQQATNRKIIDARIKAEARAAKDGAKAHEEFYATAIRAVQFSLIKDISSQFMQLGQSVADLRNELADTATRTGLSTETLAGLKLAAEGANLELGSLDSALVGFPKRMADMARGTGEAAIAFKALDIDVQDSNGNLRESDEVLRETVSALQSIESPTEKAALATQLFGESGSRLLQSLSGTELEEFIDQAERFGLDVGPEAVESAKRFQRASAEMTASFEKMQGVLVDAMDFTGILEGLSTLTIATIAFGRDVPEILKAQFEVMASNIRLSILTIPTALKVLVNNFNATEKELNKLITEQIKNTDEYQRAADAATRYDDVLQKQKANVNAAVEGLIKSRNAAQAQTKAKDSETEAVEKGKTGLEEYNKAVEEVINSTVVLLSLDERRKKSIDELRASMKKSSDEFFEAQEKQKKIEDEKDAEEKEKLEQMKRDQADYASFMADTFIQITAQHKQSLERQAEDNKEALEENLEKRKELLKEIQAAETEAQKARLRLDLASLNAEIETQKTREKVTKKRLLQMFRMEQAQAIADIAIKTAQAVMTGAAMFGPPPISPLGVAAAISAGVLGATQAAMVAAQKPPSFHSGGVISGAALQPDEQMIVARQGEAILNQRAVEAIGEQGVDRLNQGAGNAGGTTVQQIVFEGRVLDTMMARVIDAGGQLSDRINAGRQPPGISMVYGA